MKTYIYIWKGVQCQPLFMCDGSQPNGNNVMHMSGGPIHWVNNVNELGAVLEHCIQFLQCMRGCFPCTGSGMNVAKNSIQVFHVTARIFNASNALSTTTKSGQGVNVW